MSNREENSKQHSSLLQEDFDYFEASVMPLIPTLLLLFTYM